MDGKVIHGIGYFVFFYAAILVIHLLMKAMPVPVVKVSQPRSERFWAIGLSIVGTVLLSIHFYCRARNIVIPPAFKVTMFVFALPVPLAIYLFAKGYGLADLGLRLRPIKIWAVSLAVWVLAGLFAYLTNANGMQLQKAMSYGFTEFILQGVITAGLSEEFLRFVLQTRLRNVIDSPLFCVVIASAVWSLMHLPIDLYQGGNAYEIARYTIQIIPIGFVWGYMTYRTGSILPAVFVHGFNIWGLQNS